MRKNSVKPGKESDEAGGSERVGGSEIIERSNGNGLE